MEWISKPKFGSVQETKEISFDEEMHLSPPPPRNSIEREWEGGEGMQCAQTMQFGAPVFDFKVTRIMNYVAFSSTPHLPSLSLSY